MFKFYFSAVTYGIAFLIIGVYHTIVFVFHRSSMTRELARTGEAFINCIRKLVVKGDFIKL